MPVKSKAGHMQLIAVSSDNRELARAEIPFGCNSVEIMEGLFDLLELEDPAPRQRLKAI